MVSLGANTSLGDLCAAQPANLTSGLCPVTKVSQLEEMINTTKLLDACHSVDPLKECIEEPICQSQVIDIATQMAGQLVDDPGQCKRQVNSRWWLIAKTWSLHGWQISWLAFMCECPLEFGDPMPVAKACGCSSTPSSATCCRAIDGYLLEVQQQMLITNLHALRCVTFLASMLQNMSVFTDIYFLCGIDLKNFSLQGVGGQGCLLSSLPSDIMSNVTCIDFTCDLNDDIATPWVQTLKTDATYSVCGRSPVALSAIPESSMASWTIDFQKRNFLIMALCVVFIISKL
ncbi:uncharacterized GPI-anchored protein At1g61900 [Physcomitrium patens]|uniref:uncharacterized GPI-anchored protein At1g61900 n=1 Tax=Physcomitrium patens TaxID=3218 RepID=UPI000D165873|nr:uncharacterized GPI-anchored protein At1g61900-like [Physcomitrium patens]|eukprot:XP_024376662.1 uncharacterized GPI-anchored protein At1g61900-like [Physcomitrella patens]